MSRLAAALATASLTGALVLAVAADGRATRDRPPAAHTGGFGEPTCEICHLPDGGPKTGRLSLAGMPQAPRPGETHEIRVSLHQPAMGAAGFQLSVRFVKSGAQAGTLAVAPADSGRADITVAGDVAYAHHVYQGTAPVSADSTSWTLLWTAPLAGGAIVVHVVANAADGDDSPIGDVIYREQILFTDGRGSGSVNVNVNGRSGGG